MFTSQALNLRNPVRYQTVEWKDLCVRALEISAIERAEVFTSQALNLRNPVRYQIVEWKNLCERALEISGLYIND